ncbi:MAG: 5,6-dimethylbenzimidazole synthase, partial [Planctomycetota bacterium]
MTGQAKTHAEVFHGGIDLAELEQLGKAPDQILDLSSNILTVQHPSSVRQAMFSSSVAAYPDRDCSDLRQRIAERHSISRESIVIGNGCCDLIHQLARAMLREESRVLILEPTFSEYRRASELAGAYVEGCFATPGDSSTDWADAISSRLSQIPIDLVWICNPNNPCGSSRDRKLIEELARNQPETIFAIDESYIDFAELAQSVIKSEIANLVCLRSLTKSHALAGIRLGYLVADDPIVQSLKAKRVPWSVNTLAQAAGVAALKAQPQYDEAISDMRLNRSRLVEELQQRDLRPLDSDANFLLLPGVDAGEFRANLLRRNVLVRDCSSFELGGCVRIAVGDEAAVVRLLAAIDQSSEDGLTIARTTVGQTQSLRWGKEFQIQLRELFRLRRDVRRFRSNLIPADCMQRWIDVACMAPSVGLSQPWRFISVKDPSLRAEIASEFEHQNELAADDFDTTERAHYMSLKLAGIREAPEQLAVYVVTNPEKGRGLGRRTMPDTVEYSVVAAIQNFWLAARAEGVGVG